MIILNQKIQTGKLQRLDANIAKLPSGTVIDIPIMIYKSKQPGPVLLLIAGMHGDEINGVEIMRRIISQQIYKVDCGTVICIPVINVYGFINFSRDVPDGKDINRSFPGVQNGSLASQVAHFLMQDIIPNIDYGIDFHTGGQRINNYPQIRARLDDPENEALAAAFGTCFTINSPYRDKSLRKAAANLGKKILVYEGGESLRLRKNAIDEGINGTLRVMKHLGMIKDAPAPRYENKIITSSKWIRAKVSGLHYATVRNGAKVSKKDVLGEVSDPFGEYNIKITSPEDMYVVGINNNPVINRGDALFHLGIMAE
jgi:predicted deacylase